MPKWDRCSNCGEHIPPRTSSHDCIHCCDCMDCCYAGRCELIHVIRKKNRLE